jgi:putative effector of murein hydrolase
MVRVRRAIVPTLAAIAVGPTVAVASAVLVATSLGAAPETTASLVPKSVTMPIAMAIVDAIGGLPSLAAALVMLTGIIGVAVAPAIFGLLRVRDERARGVALGVAAHAIGLTQAFQSGQVIPAVESPDRRAALSLPAARPAFGPSGVTKVGMTGTFAGVAMGLTGLLTAVAVPFVLMLR